MNQMVVDKNGPKAFILVPNGESSVYHPENDQIWALCLDASETCPFYLHTTYQLRAKSMRLFPNIIFGRHTLTQPGDFLEMPTVTCYTPSFIEIRYQAIHQLQVRFCAFIPEPEVLVGTTEIEYLGDEPIQVICETAAVLNPMDTGHPTRPFTIGSNHLLTGQSHNVFPTLSMSSGPKATSNPYPALRIPVYLEAGEKETLHWALASKDDQTASLDTARKFIAVDWERTAQIHLKAHAKQTIVIKTGHPDWDAAFQLAQSNALTHLVTFEEDQYPRTFIRNRTPDLPTSKNDQMNDLTLLDTLHLFEVLLPAHADDLIELIKKFIYQVDDQGVLPSKIHQHPGGRKINEPPLLASLCLALYEIKPDVDFLRQAFPILQRFYNEGWSAGSDQELDSLPAWESPSQLQLNLGLFNFDIWDETGMGLDIRTAESPALAAMLLREASALKKIAQILGDRSARIRYGKIAKNLQERMQSMWDEQREMFTYRDRRSHRSPARELYYPGRIRPMLSLNKRFSEPQRLQVHLTTHDENPCPGIVSIQGWLDNGEECAERFQPPALRWVAGRAHATSQHVFTGIESVAFEGFNPNDHFLVETANYTQEDISCMLPVWSGGLPKDQFSSLVKSHLDPQAPELSHGIPDTWSTIHPLPEGLPQHINILWNTLIIAGLARQGFAQEAVGWFTSLMSRIIQGLKEFNGFYPSYNCDNGIPTGQPNAITGLAPLRVFLQIAGIKLIRPGQVALLGSNPFPWPIEVRWQGLWLRKAGSETHILFPDGTHYHSQATKPLIVTSRKVQEQL